MVVCVYYWGGFFAMGGFFYYVVGFLGRYFTLTRIFLGETILQVMCSPVPKFRSPFSSQ